MKQLTEALKQELKMNNETTKSQNESAEAVKAVKVVRSAQTQHIQKIQPTKGAAIVSDPGGCRPTGL